MWSIDRVQFLFKHYNITNRRDARQINTCSADNVTKLKGSLNKGHQTKREKNNKGKESKGPKIKKGQKILIPL